MEAQEVNSAATWGILVYVFIAGGIGGFVTGLFDPPSGKKGYLLWRSGRECKDMSYPGWMGYMLLGGVAAVVFWSLYGPVAGVTIIGDGGPAQQSPYLTLGQLASCLLIGMGGGGFLHAEAERRCLQARQSKQEEQEEQEERKLQAGKSNGT